MRPADLVKSGHALERSRAALPAYEDGLLRELEWIAEAVPAVDLSVR